MGHEVNFRTFDKNTSVEEMHKHSVMWAFTHVDREENPSGSYDNPWYKHDRVFGTYEEACDFLKREGAYNDGCVMYREPKGRSAKMKNISERIINLKVKRAEFEEKHDVRNRKSEFIGCTKCKSKVAKEFLNSNKCPVCGTDLRAEYITAKINDYCEKVKALEREYRSEEKKQAEKGIVKWVVKTEVHN